MKFWELCTVPYSDLPREIYYGQDLKEKAKKPEFEKVEYIGLYSYKEKKSKGSNFYHFCEFSNLLSVDLSLTNITDFDDFTKCQKIKRIETAYCRNLTSFKGVSQLADTLEVLLISNAKKLKIDDEFLQLRNLKMLDLNSTYPIDDLSFLKKFPKLESIRFFDTNIIDGDLTPIIEHPNIVFAGYYNKRHYNIKADEMEKVLKEKERKILEVSK